MARLLLCPSGATAPLAAAPSFRFALGTLARGDTAEPIATYRNHGWISERRFYTRIALKDRVLASFEDGDTDSPAYGPFDTFELIDGVAYADAAVFARLDEDTGRWTHAGSKSVWPSMVVCPADSPMLDG